MGHWILLSYFFLRARAESSAWQERKWGDWSHTYVLYHVFLYIITLLSFVWNIEQHCKRLRDAEQVPEAGRRGAHGWVGWKREDGLIISTRHSREEEKRMRAKRFGNWKKEKSRCEWNARLVLHRTIALLQRERWESLLWKDSMLNFRAARIIIVIVVAVTAALLACLKRGLLAHKTVRIPPLLFWASSSQRRGIFPLGTISGATSYYSMHLVRGIAFGSAKSSTRLRKMHCHQRTMDKFVSHSNLIASIRERARRERE